MVASTRVIVQENKVIIATSARRKCKLVIGRYKNQLISDWLFSMLCFNVTNHVPLYILWAGKTLLSGDMAEAFLRESRTVSSFCMARKRKTLIGKLTVVCLKVTNHRLRICKRQCMLYSTFMLLLPLMLFTVSCHFSIVSKREFFSSERSISDSSIERPSICL